MPKEVDIRNAFQIQYFHRLIIDFNSRMEGACLNARDMPLAIDHSYQIGQYNTLFLASIMAASAEMSMNVDGESSMTRPSQHRNYSQGIRASSLPAYPSQYTVGYVYSPEMMIHFSPHGHPEDPERITRIYEAIAAAGLISGMKQLPIRPVKREESLLVHSEDHWHKVRDIQREYRKFSWDSEFLSCAYQKK